jgi:hypothetical protein
MAGGLQEQLTQAGMTGISFEERLALLVDREVHWRNDKRQARLLKQAHLKYPQAAIEDVDARSGRGLDRRAVMSLALGDWIDSGHSVLITGHWSALGLKMTPNLLALAEALAATGKADEALVAWNQAEALARQRLAAGDPDAGEWIDQASRAAAAGR